MAKQRVFKTKTFARWMNKSDLTDPDLYSAVEEMVQGLIDANLGGNVFKKRVSLGGQGKRSGARTIVASKLENDWFFLFAFAKNEKANIDKTELRYFQEAAKALFELSAKQLDIAVNNKELMEVKNDNS